MLLTERKNKRTELTVTRNWMKSSRQVLIFPENIQNYICYDGGNKRVLLFLFVKVNYNIYCTELYK